ncbi:hypothetical protein AVEN_201644-1, partial [Araneus ventricosus]
KNSFVSKKYEETVFYFKKIQEKFQPNLQVNHKESNPLKKDSCNSSNTEVGVLKAITGPYRKRYVSSSVRGDSTPPLLYPRGKREPAYSSSDFSSPYSECPPVGEF